MKAALKLEVEMIAKAIPPDGVSMDELEAKLLAAGNVIVRREDDGIVIAHVKQPALEIYRPQE